MMTRIHSLLSVLARRCALLALLGVTLATLATSAQAGGGPNPGTDPQTNASSPGDDVTSLPFSAPSGLTLVGSPRALRALVLRFDGRGSVTVQRLAPGLVAATFVGEVSLTLDRARLSQGQVLTLYRGGQDETGILTLVTQSPTLVETERLPLPLPRMAASTLTGRWLTLQAFSDLSTTSVAVQADRSTVVLTQFVR